MVNSEKYELVFVVENDNALRFAISYIYLALRGFKVGTFLGSKKWILQVPNV